MEQKLIDLVDARSDEIIRMLQELIRIETTNPYCGDANPAGERRGQEYLQPVLEQMGADIDLFDCPDDIYQRSSVIGPRNRDFSDRPNLVATWDFGGDGPTVVVNGHMDTVGVDTFDGDPFSATISDGKMRGRGTSDCKGGIVCGVSAIQGLLTVADNLKGKLIFESVVDEEANGSGAGTLACLAAGYGGDMQVFVDGADDTLTIGCNGCLTAAVNVPGEAGHAARGTGVNAIDKAILIHQAISDFKAEREAQRPTARLNLGLMRGGIHPAVVPAEARLEMNIVYELDEAEASKQATGVWGAALLRQQYERYIRAAENNDQWLRDHPCEIEWIKDLVPFDEPQEQPLVQRFIDTFTNVTGRGPTVNRLVAWSDACWPSAVGGIPTFLYGPSAPNSPHTDNEYVEIAALLRCVKVLSVFLLRELT
jgi:acetylornithine deacetylase